MLANRKFIVAELLKSPRLGHQSKIDAVLAPMEGEQTMANEKDVGTTDTKNEGVQPEPVQVPVKKAASNGAPPKKPKQSASVSSTAKPALTGLNG